MQTSNSMLQHMTRFLQKNNNKITEKQMYDQMIQWSKDPSIRITSDCVMFAFQKKWLLIIKHCLESHYPIYPPDLYEHILLCLDNQEIVTYLQWYIGNYQPIGIISDTISDALSYFLNKQQ
jgi:hypothetical protein